LPELNHQLHWRESDNIRSVTDQRLAAAVWVGFPPFHTWLK
jgi:hypothetical protein